jgi:ABC-2 type transport system permease protein
MIRFPRIVIPLSVSLTAIFNLALNLVVVVALAHGVTPRSSWLGMIPIVLGFVVLATSFGMLPSVV